MKLEYFISRPSCHLLDPVLFVFKLKYGTVDHMKHGVGILG